MSFNWLISKISQILVNMSNLLKYYGHVSGAITYSFEKKANYKFVERSDGSIQFDLINDQSNRILEMFRKEHMCPKWLYVKDTCGQQRKIASVFITPNPDSARVLLCSHGGTTTIGDHVNYYFTLGKLTGCNVFAYDYAGFGLSEGPLTEDRLLSDAEAAYDHLVLELNIKSRNIILHGQSLGTVVSIHLASKHKSVAGLILISPFLQLSDSRKRAFFQQHSIEKVEQIHCSTLVIHGELDDVTMIDQAKEIHATCYKPVEPLFLADIGHWDIELRPELLNRIRQFIDKEIN